MISVPDDSQPANVNGDSGDIDQAAGDLGRSADWWLLLVLRLVAVITWLAFGAAVMPEKWIVEAAEALGFDPFPHSPLTFYLARNLSLLYGMVGAGLWIITLDIERYRPLIRIMALGTMAFGVLQLVVDGQSAMPAWWTLGESTSTFLGGVAIWWLDSVSRRQRRQA